MNPSYIGIDQIEFTVPIGTEQYQRLHSRLHYESKDRIKKTLDWQTVGDSGYLDRIRIKLFEGKIKVKTNLPKLISGNNVIPCQFSQFEKALEFLSSKLEVDCSTGKINYLEYNITLGVSMDILYLFRSMGHLPRFNWSAHEDGSKTYSNSTLPQSVSRKITCYDKLAEVHARLKNSPAELSSALNATKVFQDTSPVRFEYRISGRELHGEKKLYCSDLLSLTTWTTLSNSFADLLEKIAINDSSPLLKVDIASIKPSDLKTHLARVGLMTVGSEEVGQEIRQARRGRKITSERQRELLTLVKQLLKFENVLPHEAVAEETPSAVIQECIDRLRSLGNSLELTTSVLTR